MNWPSLNLITYFLAFCAPTLYPWTYAATKDNNTVKHIERQFILAIIGIKTSQETWTRNWNLFHQTTFNSQRQVSHAAQVSVSKLVHCFDALTLCNFILSTIAQEIHVGLMV